ncbi:MAG: tRNA 2-thiouridine(34) synthase MnmA [Anaerolineaceae bacterium]|nr:tRNA 2-thiouridine(34) synthase MnmA [Anaerolineaceae bacterium]
MSRILVGMSGGVDSSVAARLLIDEGHDVTGITLQLWQYADEAIKIAEQDVSHVQEIADFLKIPLIAADVRNRFRKSVVSFFIEGYEAGITPNPCFYCNRVLKWAVMLEEAERMGFDYAASGHYAQIIRDDARGVHLFRGKDRKKDQSYVLASLSRAQLQKIMLPLGKYSKPQIREIARGCGLPSASAEESQDICFLPDNGYGDLLKRYSSSVSNPGPIVDVSGKVLGEHQGLAFYTIGQRKGLGVYAPLPMYVIEKQLSMNTLVIGPKESFGQGMMKVGSLNWISGETPEVPGDYDVEIRYHAKPHQGTISWLSEDKIQVTFKESLRDITPGQAAVFYQEQEVLGSGIIELN